MTYHTVISSARILDGCGNPWYWGDIAIQDGHIVAIAPPGTLHAAHTIDAAGRFTCPGFIDIHTHSDLSILVNRPAESAVRQGATTHVIGNCGMSPAPASDEHLDEIRAYWGPISDQPEVTWQWRSFKQYLQVLESAGLGINIAPLVGHGALRLSTMGNASRRANASDMNAMQAHLESALEAGAFGMSTGLVYPPGCFADTNEIIELCRIVAAHRGLYTSHIRGERETILEAVREAIHIGQVAGLPVQISHNAPKFGAPFDATANLHLVDEARLRGQDVTVDNDLHTDLGPALTSGLPQEYEDLPAEQIILLLKDPQKRLEIRREIVDDLKPAFGPVGLLKHAQWQRITLLHAPHSPGTVGKTIQAIAQDRGCDAFDAYFDLIIENGHAAEAIFDYIDEKNIRLLLQHPCVMICSDGQVRAPYGFLNDPAPYEPCSYGEFPGLLERYVRNEAVLTLQEAIRKITSFPAQRLGLWDHGILRPGAWADIVIFDLDRIHDRATNLFPHSYPFENFPHQYPQGIDYVFVNGVLVVDGENHTGALPGVVLRRAV